MGPAGEIVLVAVEVAVRPKPKFSVPATYRYTVPAARAALSAVCYYIIVARYLVCGMW